MPYFELYLILPIARYQLRCDKRVDNRFARANAIIYVEEVDPEKADFETWAFTSRARASFFSP